MRGKCDSEAKVNYWTRDKNLHKVIKLIKVSKLIKYNGFPFNCGIDLIVVSKSV